MSDVAGNTKQSHGSALGIAHNRALRRNPARLTGMQVVRWGHYSVFGVPNATGALCLCQGSIYAHEVLGMNEAPRLIDRHWRHVVSMNLRGTCIALEVAGGKIRAECTKLGSIEGQLKAFLALLERRFARAPVGE